MNHVPHPTRHLRVLLVALALMATTLVLPVASAGAVATPSADRGSRATLQTFRREWVGHTRSVQVSGRRAVEDVYDGCCEQALLVTYRLSAPKRRGGAVVARAKVLEATYADWIPDQDRLRPGQVVRLRVRGDVLYTPHTFYCDPQDYHPDCGA